MPHAGHFLMFLHLYAWFHAERKILILWTFTDSLYQ